MKKRNWIVLIFLLLIAVVILLLLNKPDPSGDPLDYIWIKAKELSFNKENIEKYVKGLRAEKYQGALRGAVGTLWNGGGNEIDRSILRTTLFQTSGIKTDSKSPESPQLCIIVRTTYADKTNDETPLNIKTSEISAKDIILRYEKSGDTIRSSLSYIGVAHLGEDRVQDALRQDLIFKFKGETIKREIFTKQYKDEGYPSFFHPDNVHLIRITTGFVGENVLDVEKERINLNRDNYQDNTNRTLRMLSYNYLALSDKNARDMEKAFKVKAYFNEPRITIFSTEFEEKDGKTLRHTSIDLRKNNIHVIGDIKKYNVARSYFEISLEGEVLKQATKQPVLTAAEIFSKVRRPNSVTVLSRIELYGDHLSRLHKEGKPGARVVLAVDGLGDMIAFEKLNDNSIKAVPISQEAKKALRHESLSNSPLTKKSFSPDDFKKAKVDIDLFASHANADINYVPKLRYIEPVKGLIIKDSRIFWYSKNNKIKLWEIQFTKISPEVVLEGVDHWNKGKKVHNRLRKMTIPKNEMESSHTFTVWYGTKVKDILVSFFSRTMYRELVERGWTDYQFAKQDKSLTKPIRLFLIKRDKKIIHVNNQPREVPVLIVAGDYVHNNPKLEPNKTFKKIIIKERKEQSVINHYVILDDPKFPYDLGGKNIQIRIQTKIPVHVTDAKNGKPIYDALISVLPPDEQKKTARTWGDGIGYVPIIKQEFGKFRVNIIKDGYKSYSEIIDFTKEESIPLKVKLEPAPPPIADQILWISDENLETALPKLQALNHVKDIIRESVTGHPNIAIMIPNKPVQYHFGPVHAWYRYNLDTFEITGVTYDGLYGSTRLGGYQQKIANIIYYLHGVYTPWWGYSAGRLDAMGLMIFHGKEFKDNGHSHAMGMAKQAAEDAISLLKDTLGRFKKLGGYDTEELIDNFEKGTKAGIAFLDNYFQ